VDPIAFLNDYLGMASKDALDLLWKIGCGGTRRFDYKCAFVKDDTGKIVPVGSDTTGPYVAEFLSLGLADLPDHPVKRISLSFYSVLSHKEISDAVSKQFGVGIQLSSQVHSGTVSVNLGNNVILSLSSDGTIGNNPDFVGGDYKVELRNDEMTAAEKRAAEKIRRDTPPPRL
jgi:hypothetical protein